MAKIVHITIMLELEDDTNHPDDWDCWPAVVSCMPDIQSFSILNTEIRPYSRMEDDPILHTQH